MKNKHKTDKQTNKTSPHFRSSWRATCHLMQRKTFQCHSYNWKEKQSRKIGKKKKNEKTYKNEKHTKEYIFKIYVTYVENCKKYLVYFQIVLKNNLPLSMFQFWWSIQAFLWQIKCIWNQWGWGWEKSYIVMYWKKPKKYGLYCFVTTLLKGNYQSRGL